jgi:hypothetical protein
MAGEVKLVVQMSAEDRARKALVDHQKALKKNVDEMIKAGVAQSKLGARVATAIQGQGMLKRALVGTADAASRVQSAFVSVKGALAAGAVVAGAKAFFDFAKQGAESADQFRVLSQRIQGFGEIVSRVKKTTAGMLSTKEIQMAAAAFDAFGLDVGQLDVALAEATKTAIRTGQSASHMVESLATGVSRMSAPILDNLGIQIKMSAVVERATVELGKEADAISDTEKKAMLLKMALEQLAEANKHIALDETEMAQFTRLEVVLADLADKAAQAGSEAVSWWLATFTGSGDITAHAEDLNRALTTSTETLTENLSGAMGEIRVFTRDGQKVVEGAKEAQTALVALQKRLATLSPEQKIAAWEEYARTVEGVSGAHYAQIRSLYGLEAAYRAVEGAADAARAATGGTFGHGAPTGGETAFQTPEQAAAAAKAAREAAAKRSRRGRRRRGPSPEELAERAAAAAERARFAELQRVHVLRAQLRVASQAAKIDKVREELRAKVLQIQQRALKIQDVGLRDQTVAIQTELAQIENAKKLHAIHEQIHDAQRKAEEAAKKAREAEAARFREALEEQRALRAEMVETAAAGIGDAFSGAAGLLSDLDHELSELGRPEKYQRAIAGMNAIAQNIQGAAQTLNKFGEASGDSAKQVALGVQAGLQVVGPAVAAFVEGTKEKALIMGAFEAAMAVATAFTNPAESIGHGIAAAMMFAIAGMAGGKPAASAAGGAEGASAGGGGGFAGGGGSSAGSAEQPTVVINLSEGFVFGRPQEIGREVAERLYGAMAGTGMQAGAF